MKENQQKKPKEEEKRPIEQVIARAVPDWDLVEIMDYVPANAPVFTDD